MFTYPQPTPQQYNGMFGSYQQPQQSQKQEIVKVHGEDGAKAYPLPPNSSVLLLDETRPLIWLKTTDGAGFPSITAYTISVYQPEPQPDFKSLEERIAKLEGAVMSNASTKSNTSANSRSKSE